MGILYCTKASLLTTPNNCWASVERVLKNEGIAYDFVQSEARGSVTRLVKMFINNGYKTIVIVGGDSALNDAVNCLMQTERQTRNEIALGIIPNGVMNDFAHFWNFKEESTLKSGILGSRSNFAEYFFIQNYSYPVLPQIPIEFLKTEKSSQKTKN